MTTTDTPIVFLDVETTGLARDDEIWEVAAIRRDPADGTETELHLFVEHDETKCARLPEEFRADHAARFPSACSGRVTSRRDACHAIRHFLNPHGVPPVMVGINPGFDLDHISALFREEFPLRDPTPWHYTPVDARHLAVGALMAYPPRFVMAFDGAPEVPRMWAPTLHHIPDDQEARVGVLGPPWGSEDVSRALGIDPDQYARHTAMGDVQWAMAIYDAVTAGHGSTALRAPRVVPLPKPSQGVDQP